MIWTHELIEARLIEAFIVFNKMPDKESGWLHNGKSSLPPHLKNPKDWLDLAYHEMSKPRIGLLREQVTRAWETLEWITWPTEDERRVIQGILPYKVKSPKRKNFPYKKIVKEKHLKFSADTARRRYSSGISQIAITLTS